MLGALLLTSTTTMAISDNATEVPEARLTAITPEASHTWSAGALACGWVTGATVGAMWVAMAGAYKRRKHWSQEFTALSDHGQGWVQVLTGTASEAYSLGSSDIVLAAAIGGLGTVWEGHRQQWSQGRA